jgi:hypothetical protein
MPSLPSLLLHIVRWARNGSKVEEREGEGVSALVFVDPPTLQDVWIELRCKSRPENSHPGLAIKVTLRGPPLC